MGDSGKLYVSPDVVPVYKSMLPFASIITPNWFETEYYRSPLRDRFMLIVAKNTY
jgi:pyridoxal/pyridoxine/pyridoxamine kinase